MSIRIVVYGRDGDGAAFSAIGQMRSIMAQSGIDASIQLVTDPTMTSQSGVDELPAVTIDGAIIAQGYVPSRTELQRALQTKHQNSQRSGQY